MEQKLKVNAAFQLEVPIQTDSAGRRRSIPDQVHPYISDYFANLQSQLHFVKFRIDTCNRGKENYDAQNDFDIFEKMSKLDMSRPFYQEGDSKDRWETQKYLECWEFFKMTWKEFKTLSWTQQAKLRETHGVIWENNSWVRKGK